jgi:hypothetical protein
LTLIAVSAMAAIAVTTTTRDKGRSRSSVVAGKVAGLLALKAPKRDIAGLDEPGNLLAPVSDADVFDTNELEASLGGQEANARLIAALSTSR